MRVDRSAVMQCLSWVRVNWSCPVLVSLTDVMTVIAEPVSRQLICHLMISVHRTLPAAAAAAVMQCH